MFSLVIREKGGEQRDIAFDKEEISIGRIQGNDIVLPKGNISKRHARIMVKDGKFVIVDLRSTNGTYVNGHKISSPMVITGNDKVYIGDFVLQLTEQQERIAEPPAPEPLELAPEIPEPAPAPHAVAPEPIEQPPEPQPAYEEPLPPVEPETAAMEADDLGDDETRAFESAAVAAPAPAPEAPPAPEPHAFRDVVPPEAVEAPDEGGIDDLSEFEHYIRVLAMLHQRAGEEVFAGRDIESIDFSSQWEELENAVYAVVERAHQGGEVPGFLDVGGLTTDILYEYTALGPIEYFLADDRVTEIEVNAYNQIYVRRGSERSLEWKSFSSPAALLAVVDRLARGQGLDPEVKAPILHGRLEDGTVYRGFTPPLSPLGPTLVFRKPRRDVRTMQQLIEEGVLSVEMAGYLEQRVTFERSTVLVAGRNNSGRTTFLNALAYLIPETERIAVVEETQQLQLPHPNVVRLDPSEGAVEVVHELRPDRVLVGEVTQETLLPFLRLSAGRMDGCMGTTFARSTEDLFARLRSFLDVEEELTNPSVQDTLMGLSLEVIVFVGRDAAGGVRVSSISEVSLDAAGAIRSADVFRFQNGDDPSLALGGDSEGSFVRVA